MKNILVPLADGFEEIEAISIIDVLRRGGIPVMTVSITREIFVTGSHGITVKADSLFENTDPETVQMVVLPGGMPGSKNLDSHDGLKKLILRQHNEGKPAGAICAAPLVLGNLGLLSGKEATCYPGFEKYLTGATFNAKSVVVSGNTITGKGAGVAIKFALAIVAMFKGNSAADDLAAKLMME